MVNGHTVQQSQVVNLFHSVQLNVNNPHFLIMQGRITKVLNMKPPEILAMIEEAAGTRMFETKKQASIKTIEKKQSKVDEITKCIDEEITPTLENLRFERQIYHEWQANNAEFEQLDRFCVACDFKTAEDKVKFAEDDKKNLEREEKQFLDSQHSLGEQANECTEKIEEITLSHSTMGKVLVTLNEEEAKVSREVVIANTTLTNHKELIQKEEESIQSLTKQLETLDLSKQQKDHDLQKCQMDLKIKEEAANQLEMKYKELRERYQNAAMGVANEQTAEFLSIPEQIRTWEKVLRESTSKLQTNDQQMRHKHGELIILKKKISKQSSSVTTVAKEIEALKAAIAKKEEQCQVIHAAGDQDQHLRNQVSRLTAEINGLRDNLEGKQARLHASLRFDFQDPERNFNRQRVKGRVAQLFRIKGNNASMALALETVAGARLQNVVVDNEETGAMLIKRGNLRSRTTFLPLNKIAHYVIEPAKVIRAKQIAERLGGSAHLALDLISFDESVRHAMEHIFGSMIVCSSSDIAKNVAFDEATRARTVSYAGDTFDPAGTLTAGIAAHGNDLLGDLFHAQHDEAMLETKTKELRQIKANLEQLEQTVNSSRDLLNSLESLKHELQMKESQMAESDYSQLNAQIQELETELKTLENVTCLSCR